MAAGQQDRLEALESAAWDGLEPAAADELRERCVGIRAALARPPEAGSHADNLVGLELDRCESLLRATPGAASAPPFAHARLERPLFALAGATAAFAIRARALLLGYSPLQYLYLPPGSALQGWALTRGVVQNLRYLMLRRRR